MTPASMPCPQSVNAIHDRFLALLPKIDLHGQTENFRQRGIFRQHHDFCDGAAGKIADLHRPDGTALLAVEFDGAHVALNLVDGGFPDSRQRGDGRGADEAASPSGGERVTIVGLSDILIGLPTVRYLPRTG